MNVLGLGHIGVWVRNMEETIDLYKNKLGMDITVEKDFHDPGMDKDICIRFFEKGSLVIEAIHVPDADIADRGRIEHIAIAVDDIEAAKADLEKKGISFPGGIEDDPQVGLHGCRFVLFEGPSGEKLELNQML